MSALSGHKTYSDILKSEYKLINNSDVYYFDKLEFSEITIRHINNN